MAAGPGHNSQHGRRLRAQTSGVYKAEQAGRESSVGVEMPVSADQWPVSGTGVSSVSDDSQHGAVSCDLGLRCQSVEMGPAVVRESE